MIKTLLTASTALLIAAGTSQAGFSAINGGGTSGSQDGQQANLWYFNATIANGGALQRVYNLSSISALGTRGVDFTGTSGTDTIDFIRVHDFAAGGASDAGNTLFMSGVAANIGDTTGAFTDQVWSDSVVAFDAQVRFAGQNQALFTRGGASGASTGDNLRVSNVGTGINPSATYTNNPGLVPSSPFRWLRSEGATNATTPSGSNSSSRFGDADIGPSFDNMIAYEVRRNGAAYGGGLRTWLICFEDLNTGDFDYNDLVVELNVVAVPLPPAAYAGLGTLGLAGIGAFIRRHRLAANA